MGLDASLLHSPAESSSESSVSADDYFGGDKRNPSSCGTEYSDIIDYSEACALAGPCSCVGGAHPGTAVGTQHSSPIRIKGAGKNRFTLFDEDPKKGHPGNEEPLFSSSPFLCGKEKTYSSALSAHRFVDVEAERDDDDSDDECHENSLGSLAEFVVNTSEMEGEDPDDGSQAQLTPSQPCADKRPSCMADFYRQSIMSQKDSCFATERNAFGDSIGKFKLCSSFVLKKPEEYDLAYGSDPAEDDYT